MRTWNIFYNADKTIAWSSDGDVTESIIAAQAEEGLSYLQVNQADIPVAENFYVNDDGTGIVARTVFEPVFSTMSPAIDEVVTVTGLPIGTEVLIDEVSQGTLSTNTLSLTIEEPGVYLIEFRHFQKMNIIQKLRVRRYGE